MEHNHFLFLWQYRHPRASPHSRHGVRISVLTVSRGRKLLSEAKVIKQSLYLFCLSFVMRGHGHGGVGAQTRKTWSWVGELSITFEAVRDIMDTTGQALELGAWVRPTWQNHPAI